MATGREKKPGVWEVRVLTGIDVRGRPTQISRTVRGWTDVDDNGMLTIDSAIEVIRPGEQRELRDAPTKTGNARRLTLDPDTLNAIWALRREREPYGPWMFGVGPDLVPPDHIGWWWTRARKASSIDMKWRLHDLRHWSATTSIGQGHDVRTVAGRLGHSNPAMTLRRSPTPHDPAEARAVLEAVLFADRADIPAVVQRRILAATVPPPCCSGGSRYLTGSTRSAPTPK